MLRVSDVKDYYVPRCKNGDCDGTPIVDTVYIHEESVTIEYLCEKCGHMFDVCYDRNWG